MFKVEKTRNDKEACWDVGMKILGEEIVQQTRFFRPSRARMTLWFLRIITILLVWSCVVQLLAIGEDWGSKLFISWPSCSVPQNLVLEPNVSIAPPKPSFPPKRVYKNNGYLVVSCNGGLNQMRAAICDMVAISRDLNITLIVPELDKTSFWQDPSDFHEIFDVDNFISSLRDEVRILKELPLRLKRRIEEGKFHELPPVSWSNMSYYRQQILPLLKKHKVVHLNKTDARLANNGLPLNIQKLRCRVNYNSLRFTPKIEELGKKVVDMLKKKGPFLVLHLRYEMDMLSFSGCTRGCNLTETNKLTAMRYANASWKEKIINPDLKRKDGLCPLTPEETALLLKALGIDQNIQIYIAAGEIYGGKRRLKSLADAFPNLVKKETLLDPESLSFFKNHSSQMAALDYLVSLESDVFVPTYDGNMAKVVEGHRRHLGFKQTIQLDRKVLINLIDQFNDGSLSWDDFSAQVKEAQKHRTGRPQERVMISDKPKEEDYFYANPQECLASQ